MPDHGRRATEDAGPTEDSESRLVTQSCRRMVVARATSGISPRAGLSWKEPKRISTKAGGIDGRRAAGPRRKGAMIHDNGGQGQGQGPAQGGGGPPATFCDYCGRATTQVGPMVEGNALV